MPRDKNIFTLNPTSLDMKRSVFPIKVQHKTSLNMGDIVPIYMKEILPGDTVSLDMSHIIRTSSPLVAPIMDNVYADVYFFYIPNRLLWTHWEQFCGANDTGAWTQSNSYLIPQVEIDTADMTPGTIGNYLGIPNVSGVSKIVKVSELPLRGVAKVYDDWFADENSIGPVLFTIGDTAQTGANAISYDMPCFKASRFHDLFSSCLPAPQKGASVMLPLGDKAPVYMENLASGAGSLTTNNYLLAEGTRSGAKFNFTNFQVQDGNQQYAAVDANLFADLQNATAATVNQVRTAFQLQRLLEKDARGGTRYTELVLSHFSVRSSDARLQRSEYLCGKRFPIMVDQVISQAETVSSSDTTLNPVGKVAAMSKTVGSNSMFTKSFTEHGLILGFIVLRQDHTYSEGLDKYWTKSQRFDFYYPVLANLGEQPVFKQELSIRAIGSSTDPDDNPPEASGVFGYQEAWYEYRYQPSRATGYMNPSTANSLAQWTLGDVYTSAPTLNKTFLEETPLFLDRALTVTSAATHQFICDFYFYGKQARVMPVYSVPGLIDHH